MGIGTKLRSNTGICTVHALAAELWCYSERCPNISLKDQWLPRPNCATTWHPSQWTFDSLTTRTAFPYESTSMHLLEFTGTTNYKFRSADFAVDRFSQGNETVCNIKSESIIAVSFAILTRLTWFVGDGCMLISTQIQTGIWYHRWNT